MYLCSPVTVCFIDSAGYAVIVCCGTYGGQWRGNVNPRICRPDGKFKSPSTPEAMTTGITVTAML